ncbi:oligopeptide/dipeptide ABC transporter ATP-binding protein [Candidatus Poriferisodalis sp.]|uniref:oligopeptide/dipeptide ABC transporter ATP-binding protein n=1 Tax=Candidatus Poriferisodalis sp. TaxID=3101277 RepID=UPI003B0129FA
MAGSGDAHLRPEALLSARDLVVEFPAAGGRTVYAVSGVSLDLIEGETLGLVGESGCGKSTTGRAILQLPKPTSGTVQLGGRELTELDDDTMREVRPRLQMIYQDPISSLNPRRRVRDIIAEPLFIELENLSRRTAMAVWQERIGMLLQGLLQRAAAPLRIVGLLASVAFVLWIVSEAVERRALESWLEWTQVPAAVIGFPTLALLVLVGAVALLLGLIWVLLAVMLPFGLMSRQFGEVSSAVGLAGAVVTTGASAFLTRRTWSSFGGWAQWLNSGGLSLLTAVLAVWLIASMLKPERAGASGVATTLSAMLVLQVFYVAGLDDGAKLIVLVASVVVDALLLRWVLRRYRANREAERRRAEPRVREVLGYVGINPDDALDRRPWEFSGGQAQRLSIARALVSVPQVIICDEPVSSLDVSVQAQILNLLEDLKNLMGLTLVFIAHDLAVVKNVSDRVAVMYLGKLCEVSEPDAMFAQPAHPYTDLLLAAIPHPDPDAELSAERIGGELPSPMDPPSGCRFRTRCPHAAERCAAEEPEMREIVSGRFVACHFPLVGESASERDGVGAAVAAAGQRQP